MTRIRGFSLPRFTMRLMESMSEILSSTIIDVRHARVEQLELRTSLNYQYREQLFDESLDLVITPDMVEQEGLEVHKRPALLVIDMNYAFCGDKPGPIVQSIKKWRTSCGEVAWAALPYLRKLIDKSHEKGLPALDTTGIRRDDNRDVGSCQWKNNRGAERPKVAVTNIEGNEIMAEIAPGPQVTFIHKQKPSASFGTNLASYLQLLGPDSVIVTGTTTSGFVRAMVLDAFSLNFRVAVAEEACFDRSQASHAINLCDMHAKYADAVPSSGVMTYVGTLADDLFPNLPIERRPGAAAPRLSLVSSA